MKNHWQKMGALALAMTLVAALGQPRPVFALPSCDPGTLQGLANGTSFTVKITSATLMSVPVAFCDVTGDITTEVPTANTVEFELGLPASFNERLLFRGGGGFNGYIPAGVVDGGVSVGFATAYTDSGHESVFASDPSLASLSALDGSWGLLQPGN
jgi:hypothetical protein